MNFVYKEIEEHSYTIYIYTPANLNSYGLVVDFDTEEPGEVYEVYFKVRKLSPYCMASNVHALNCATCPN